jgi:hypothetical protein
VDDIPFDVAPPVSSVGSNKKAPEPTKVTAADNADTAKAEPTKEPETVKTTAVETTPEPEATETIEDVAEIETTVETNEDTTATEEVAEDTAKASVQEVFPDLLGVRIMLSTKVSVCLLNYAVS